jgi:hypothetical protein
LNLQQDIKARQDCYSYYGEQKWFGGHRNGASGLANPDTTDINSTCFPLISGNELTLTAADYKNAVFWIQDQLESNTSYLTDDTRFWVDVVAI